MSVVNGPELVLLGLGSNIQPHAHMGEAVARISERFPQAQVSPLYRTAAVGFEGADFLNAAMALRTDVELVELDAWLTALEDGMGRRREGPRFSDRPIDVDIVAFGSRVRAAAPVLPRPDLLDEAFTLRPCADIAPQYVHPVLGRTLEVLLAEDPVAMAMRPTMTGRWWGPGQ